MQFLPDHRIYYFANKLNNILNGEDYYSQYRLLEAIGFERIGGGGSRVIFEHKLTPDVVYKYTSKYDIDANETESFVWHNASDEGRKLLAPIYYRTKNFGVLVQRKCKIFKFDKDRTEINQAYDFFELRMHNRRVKVADNIFVGDVYRYAPNIGMINDDFVVIDYAYSSTKDNYPILEWNKDCVE